MRGIFPNAYYEISLVKVMWKVGLLCLGSCQTTLLWLKTDWSLIKLMHVYRQNLRKWIIWINKKSFEEEKKWNQINEKKRGSTFITPWTNTKNLANLWNTKKK